MPTRSWTIRLALTALLVALLNAGPAAWGLNTGPLGTDRDGRLGLPIGPIGPRCHERFAADTLPPLLGDLFVSGPLETGLLADAADGRLDSHSCLTAALVAGGVSDPAVIERYQRRVTVLVDELRQSGRVAGPPRRRAQAVFEFMHERILRGGYGIDCSDLTLALDEGRFNCLSASVLYCHLAGQFGLIVSGVEMPGHVTTRLALTDGTLDIEATCPGWFRRIETSPPPPRLPDKWSRGRLPGEKGPAQGREVSGPALIATIYYNRGVDLLARGEYARAMAANLRAVQLDPSNRTAWGNLLAVLNNWAIFEGARGRFSEAVRLLEAGLALDPGFEIFAANYVHVHREWARSLRASGRWDEAARLVHRAEADPLLAGKIGP